MYFECVQLYDDSGSPVPILSPHQPSVYFMTIHDAGMTPFSLSFDEYIRMFPSAWLFEHFLKNKSGSRKILSSNALADQVARFSEPSSLQIKFKELGEAEKRLCSLVYLCGDSGLPALEKSDYLNDPAILSFIIYAGRDDAGAVRYFGFSGFEPSLRLLMAETLLHAGPVVKRAASTMSPHGREYCLSDIAVVLALAMQGLLEKKKQGGLTKNSLLKIGKLTHESFPGFTVQDRADCIIRYAEFLGVIVENDTGFACRGTAAEEWLNGSSESQCRDLAIYIGKYAGAWCRELLSELLRRAGERWLSITLFPEKARQEALKALFILHWAGIIDLAGAGDEIIFGAPVTRPSPILPLDTVDDKRRTAVRTIVVLPDFTAMLPQEISPEQLFRFSQVGILHSLDRVYKGAIDRATLNNSLARGLDSATVLRRLAEWNAPANVVETLREWIREYYRLYISDAPVLITCDKKATYEIASYEPLAGFIERMPAFAVFRIRQGVEESVKRVLSDMGYDYRMPLRESPAAPTGSGNPARCPVPVDVFKPIIPGNGRVRETLLLLKGKKYGSGLKSLDLTETMHIIDYAILTAQELTIEYGGSLLIKKGLYTILPAAVSDEAEPILDGSDQIGKKRQFTIRKIVRIGVGRS